MTRQEEIRQEAIKNVANLHRFAFILGAKWADEHPKTDINDVCMSYENWHKSRMQELIEDACGWLEDHMGEEILVKTIEQFKKAML